YDLRDGRPVQIINPATQIQMPLIDISELARPYREQEATRVAREEASERFNLKQEMMLRVKLVKLAEGEHAAFMTMHHIASDGWSMGVLMGEVTRLYGIYHRGEAGEQ